MARAWWCASMVVIAACTSFESADGPPDAAVASSADAGSSAQDGGSLTPDAPVAPDGAACAAFDETFTGWKPSPDSWGVLLNAPASLNIVTGWKGPALQAEFPLQTVGTIRAQAYRSFAQTASSCVLSISFDVRLTPTSDTTAQWILLQVRGAAGGVVQIDHRGSFWYLRMGNTQTQISAPPANVVGRMQLDIRAVGAHAAATYTLDGKDARDATDLAVVLGDKADVLFGAEVQGATTGVTRAQFDDVHVAW